MGLFSGSKKPGATESGNKNMGIVTDAFSPAMKYTSQAGDMVAGLLGIGGDPAASAAAFNRYKDSTGYNFQKDEGLRAINANKAAKGMFGSGSTGRAYAGFSNDLASTYMNNYIQNAMGLGQLGLGAGGQVLGAGQYSKGNSSKGKPGIGDVIMAGASAAALSDERLKENIVKVGEIEDLNLGIFEYNYKFDKKRKYRGVMAQDVEKNYPIALGPETHGGFKTVNYTKLPIDLEEIQ